MLNFDAHKQRPLLNHPPWLNHGLPMPLMQTLQKKVCLFQTSPAVNSKINLYCLHYDIVVSFRSRLNQKSYSFPFCTLFINGFQLKSVINGTIRFTTCLPRSLLTMNPPMDHLNPVPLDGVFIAVSLHCSVLAWWDQRPRVWSSCMPPRLMPWEVFIQNKSMNLLNSYGHKLIEEWGEKHLKVFGEFITYDKINSLLKCFNSMSMFYNYLRM